MSDFYTILINDDQSFTHTEKKRIMHRSSNIDTIRFLVKPMYNGLDMTKVNTVLEYVTPGTRTYGVRILKPSAELYKNRVEFVTPIDLDFTSEIGDLEFTINFSYLAMDGEKFVEQTRVIGYTSILIEDTVRWSDYIADSRLDNIAQMMMMNQATVEQNRINIEMMNEMMVTSLKHNTENNTLHLVNEDGILVGEEVSMDGLGNCDCEDGIPAVDFSNEAMENPDTNGVLDNVVKF